MKKIRLFHLILSTFVVMLFVMVSSTQAQSPDLDYMRYDVDIMLHEDGTFTVRETQDIRFGDVFHTGFAEIPLDFVTTIENIRVSGGDTADTISPYTVGRGPSTYSVDQEADSIYVEWEFSPTELGDEKIFVVEYDVVGGLWVYSDVNTLEWRAVPEDRSGIDVASGTVTVHLPFTAAEDALDYLAFGPEYEVERAETDTGTQLLFRANGRIPDGTAFQVLVDFPPGLVTAAAQPWQIAADTAALDYTLDRIDVELVVQEDGRLQITEQQQLTVNDGIMHTGSREFNWLFTDGITIEQIAEGDQLFQMAEDGLDNCLNCYQSDLSARNQRWVRYSETLDEVDINDEFAGTTKVEWRFPELVQGESTTFTLVYLVDGAVRLNEDGTQEIDWTVIPGYDVPVGEAQVYLRLPGRLGLEDVALSGGNMSRAEDGGIVIVPQTAASAALSAAEAATLSAGVSANTAWQVNMVLPQGATTAAKPDWQLELEAAFVTAEAYRVRAARIDLAWLVGEIGVGITAVLAAIVGWYLWGSRKVREMFGNYRTTPPSDLPPGVVAYLVDKTPSAKGALASLLHLATLGLVRINMDDEITIERVMAEKIGAGTAVTSANGDVIEVPPHAAYLFNALLPALPLGESVTLEQITPAFQQATPELYVAMAEEMVSHYYGSGNQEWRATLQKVVPFIWFVGTAVFMFTFVSGGLGSHRNPAILFVGMFGGFALMVFFMRRFARPKASLSVLGKQEAGKWLGFKAYLQEISRFGTMTEAQEIMDRYFAYAVALGVDKTLLAQVQTMGVKVPQWMGNGRYPDGTPWQNKPIYRHTPRQSDRWRRRWQQGSWLPRPPRSQTTAPAAHEGGGISLQRLSDQLTGSLESAGSKMTTMLNTAVGDAKPVDVIIRGAGHFTKLEWEPGTSMGTVMQDIMSKTQSIKPPRPAAGSGSGGYSGSGRSGGFRSSGSSRSSSRRSSSRSSSRRSSSRRSGGGGRRGFK